MNENSLVIIDNINIKTLVENISNYLKNNDVKQYNNVRMFYSKLLDTIGEDIKESYLTRILKYMSSDKPSVINIIEDFNEGIYDKELTAFFDKLVDTISHTSACNNFYLKLYNDVDFPFYNIEEYDSIVKAYKDEKYNEFIHKLFKHAFLNYKENMPGIMGRRIFLEALTINHTEYIRNTMMKASADLGCEEAARLYGDSIFNTSHDEAIIYYMKDKSNPASLWNIAFAIENKYISKKIILQFEKDFKDILDDNEIVSKIKIVDPKYDDDLLISMKIYLYLVEKYQFSKAYNSLGKLSIFNSIEYDGNRENTLIFAKKYLKKAISIGNINSMANYAIYLKNNKDDDEYDEALIRKYLKTAAYLADPYACYHYGILLVEDGKYDDAIKYFLTASKRGYIKADTELGKIYEKKLKVKDAIFYYEKALAQKYMPAIYRLIMLHYKLYMSDNKQYKGSKILCSDYIDEYYDYFTEEEKNKLDELRNSFN